MIVRETEKCPVPQKMSHLQRGSERYLKKLADVLGLRGNVGYLPGCPGEKNNDEKLSKGGVLLIRLVTYSHSQALGVLQVRGIL